MACTERCCVPTPELEEALGLSAEEVGRLTRAQREARVINLISCSYKTLDLAIKYHIEQDNRSVAAIAVLYSGGNDSTVLAHIFRHTASHAIHANTGIAAPSPTRTSSMNWVSGSPRSRPPLSNWRPTCWPLAGSPSGSAAGAGVLSRPPSTPCARMVLPTPKWRQRSLGPRSASYAHRVMFASRNR